MRQIVNALLSLALAAVTTGCGLTPEDAVTYEQGGVERHAQALLPAGTSDCTGVGGLPEWTFRIYRHHTPGEWTNYGGSCLQIAVNENAYRGEGTWPDGVAFGYHPVSFKSYRGYSELTQWIYMDGHQPDNDYEWLSYTRTPQNDWVSQPQWHPYATMFIVEFAAHGQW